MLAFVLILAPLKRRNILNYLFLSLSFFSLIVYIYIYIYRERERERERERNQVTSFFLNQINCRVSIVKHFHGKRFNYVNIKRIN